MGGGEVIETDFSTGDPGEVAIFDKTMAVHDQTEAEYNVYVVKSRFRAALCH